MTILRTLAVLATALLFACATPPPADGVRARAAAEGYGVLVMAHGGRREWNEGVLDAVAPLRERYDVEVAFGMADAATLEEGVKKLESRGATHIGVVRLFVSGESWYARTEKILGIADGAPPRPADAQHAGHGDHGGHAGHSMGFWRIPATARFALSREGLAEAATMGEVIAARARALSRDPAREDVLVVAHGPGDDGENARWLARLDARAQAVRASAPFRRVEVATLREDWPERRSSAERAIRDFVARAGKEGGTAIVIPFRVQGFGPYAKVLEGLAYRSDGAGLVPHPNVTRWLEDQAAQLRKASFPRP